MAHSADAGNPGIVQLGSLLTHGTRGSPRVQDGDLTSPLRGLRIASVPYLNARPLIHGLPQVEQAVPSQLATWLDEGRCDLVAALSLGAVISRPRWKVLPSLGVAADGPVRTVLLLHEPPLAEVEAIRPDPASRSSNLLARWVVAKARGSWPREDPLASARVVIGDPAFSHLPEEGSDLAQCWKESTGLPFVFAGWVAGEQLARDESRLAEIDAFLVELHRSALGSLDQIASAQTVVAPELALSYLQENIRYRLDERCHQGANLFASEMARAGEGHGEVPWAC